MNRTQAHIAIAILAVPALAVAQPFTLESFTFDSGGATGIVAGAYMLSGTTGQPDAGVLSAASYQCQGGFWNTAQGGSSCYANCDGSAVSPILTANDFACFLNRYAAAASYADCDGVGGLTANDFACFLNAYAAGCS